MQTNIMGFFLWCLAALQPSRCCESRASSFSFIEQRGSEPANDGGNNKRTGAWRRGGAVTIFRRGGKKFLPVLLLQSGAVRRGRTDLSLD